MEIFNHPLCTDVIGKPADISDAECSGLPVLRRDDEHGSWSISFWAPTPEELAHLTANGKVALWVRSVDAHPVVYVGVQP